MGWLILDNPLEAMVEVDRISALGRLMPETMVLRWQVFARLLQWEQALNVAEICTRICPGQAAGWLCLAYSHYRLDQPRKAWEVLLAKIAMFPNARGVPYLLACFAARAGLNQEADAWLARSAAMGGPKQIKDGPLDEEDLLISDPSAAVDRPGQDITLRSNQLGKH